MLVEAKDLSHVELLDIIASGSTDQKLRIIWSAQNLPDDIAQALAQDENKNVRYWVTHRGEVLPIRGAPNWRARIWR